jgi:Family of unknown function (DUF6284)
VRSHRPLGSDREPTPEELAAIDLEWPLIEAEMAVVDAEIRMLTAVCGPSPLDWRRLRRAEARVLREVIALLGVLLSDPNRRDLAA